MFCVIGTYIKPIEEVDAALPEHYQFLDKYFAKGIFMLAGRQIPRNGGIILCQTASRAELDAILKEDIFYQQQIMAYQVVEFIPTKSADVLQDWLK